MKNPIKHGSLYVNPSEAGYAQHRYIFYFGAYGWTRLLVWGRGLDDALESAAAWLADYAPGHLTDLREEYREALRRRCQDCDDPECDFKQPCDGCVDAAQSEAEMDMTYTESGYLMSWEWSVEEDPSRERILELQERHLEKLVYVRRIPCDRGASQTIFVRALDGRRAIREVKKSLARAGENLRAIEVTT